MLHIVLDHKKNTILNLSLQIWTLKYYTKWKTSYRKDNCGEPCCRVRVTYHHGKWEKHNSTADRKCATLRLAKRLFPDILVYTPFCLNWEWSLRILEDWGCRRLPEGWDSSVPQLLLSWPRCWKVLMTLSIPVTTTNALAPQAGLQLNCFFSLSVSLYLILIGISFLCH